MDKTNTTPLFFQIPKILHEDKRIKAQHIYIFMVLYDQLRQREFWNKTNEWISEQTKLGKSQVKLYLNDLEEWGYLFRLGMGSSRKFSLGIKLSNRAESIPDEYKTSNGSESAPVSKQYWSESEPIQVGIDTSNRSESELHSKNLFKNIIKNISSQQNPLKTTPKNKEEHPPPTAEQIDLMNKLDDGILISDLDIYKAKALKRRYEKKKVN